MRFFKALITAFVPLFLFTSVAFAHVTVNPKTIPPGFQVVTVRVPNEKDNPTIGLRVVVPDGVTVHAVEPVPGWTVTTKKEAATTPTENNKDEEGEERITEITWTGGQIGVDEFQEFPLSVQFTKTGEFAWKAYQTYQDGSVVKWEGGKDSATPASVMTVSDTASTNTADQPPSENKTSSSEWLSIAALLISVASLFIALRRK